MHRLLRSAKSSKVEETELNKLNRGEETQALMPQTRAGFTWRA